jgi:tetratricopeptide (TPR) repeat protein
MNLKIFLLLAVVTLIIGCESRLSFEELMRQGEQYFSRGNYLEAIEAFKSAAHKKPEDSGVHEALGNAYYAQIRVDNRRPTVNNANEWEDIKKTSQELKELAVKEYKIVLQKNKDNWRVRYLVATDLYNQKKYKDAITEYQELLKYNPQHAISYSMLAQSYLGERLYDLALKNYYKAYSVDHNDEYFYYNLGQAYYFMKYDDKGFEMEWKLKDMKSVFYQKLLDYRFSDRKEPLK